MLLKFTTVDMLNTTLVNINTGEVAYEITTITVPSKPEKVNPPGQPFSSSKTSTSSEQFSPIKEYPIVPEVKETNIICRRTQITDPSGRIVADVFWEGRHPKITIDGEERGRLNDLFGTTSVRFMPKVLAIPTRFDSDYIWTATADSLTLIDYSTEEIKGTFHQNVIRLPSPLKKSKSKHSLSRQTQPTSPKSLFKSPSRIFTSCSSPSSEDAKSTFVPTHVPGFGSNYLEFTPHSLANDVEIIVSFLFMEILRRGRFALTPYTFENPTIWQLKDMRDFVMSRIRRNTV